MRFNRYFPPNETNGYSCVKIPVQAQPSSSGDASAPEDSDTELLKSVGAGVFLGLVLFFVAVVITPRFNPVRKRYEEIFIVLH